MGKRKESLYFQGKRTHDWKKIKYLQDDDCGYIRKDKHMSSLILAQYDKAGVLQYKGHVTLGHLRRGRAGVPEDFRTAPGHPAAGDVSGRPRERGRRLDPADPCLQGGI